MQKESLPFYRKNPPPSGQGDDALSKILAEIDPNANLYKKKELFHREKELKRSLIAFFKVLLACLCLMLVVTLLIERYSDEELNELNAQKKELVAQMQGLSYEHKLTKDIQKKLELYKSIRSSRRVISTSAEKVFNETRSSLSLITFASGQERFRISARGGSAINVVQAIYRIMESGAVATLSLTSAEIRTSDGSFAVDLEGVYK